MKTQIKKFKSENYKPHFKIEDGAKPQLVSDKTSIKFNSMLTVAEFIRDNHIASRVSNIFSMPTLLQGIALSDSAPVFKKAKAA